MSGSCGTRGRYLRCPAASLVLASTSLFCFTCFLLAFRGFICWSGEQGASTRVWLDWTQTANIGVDISFSLRPSLHSQAVSGELCQRTYPGKSLPPVHKAQIDPKSALSAKADARSASKVSHASFTRGLWKCSDGTEILPLARVAGVSSKDLGRGLVKHLGQEQKIAFGARFALAELLPGDGKYLCRF